MTKNIEMKDLEVIQSIAARYDMSMIELGRTIVNQNKKRSERQFRVSDEEFAVISKKAKDAGLTTMRYCEYACGVFLKQKKIDEQFFGHKRYGDGRTKRITVKFKNIETDIAMMEVADKFNVEIGALIRYCALTY